MTSNNGKCEKNLDQCFTCPSAPCARLQELAQTFNYRRELPEKNGEEILASGKEPDPRNKLNHLSGGEWLYFTKTLITTSYPSEYGHEIRKQHGANKPPRLMRELIEFFTTENSLVLDPFAGVGGTLIGAAICDPPRRCRGIEINREWIDIFGEIGKTYPELPLGDIIQGDCRELMPGMPDESIDFILTDPPYNLHFKRTMCNNRYQGFANRKTDYNMESSEDGDLANLHSYGEYLEAVDQVMTQCYRVLKRGAYMAVIVRNAYQNGRYIFTHADIARVAEGINEGKGFITKGEKVWYQAGTRLRSYGYPYSYVPNIVHQYILIFQKPRETA